MEYQWGYNSTGFLTNQLDSKNIAQIHPLISFIGGWTSIVFIVFF
jgi:hypothetical protein